MRTRLMELLKQENEIAGHCDYWRGEMGFEDEPEIMEVLNSKQKQLAEVRKELIGVLQKELALLMRDPDRCPSHESELSASPAPTKNPIAPLEDGANHE